MDTKELIKKFADGEISEDQFEAEKSKLSPEDLVKLNKEAEAAVPDAVKKLIDIRRGTKKIEGEGKDDVTLATKLKEENLESAKAEFYSDFGIEKEEDRKAFEEGFNTESINVKNIISDMKRHYVAKNPEKYLALEKEKKEREAGAEDFNAGGAGATGSNNKGGQDLTGASKEAKDLIAAFAKKGKTLTVEKAERTLEIMKRGGRLE